MYKKEEIKELKLKFWDGFQTKSARLRAKHGKTRKWMLHHTGIRGVELKFEVNRQYMEVMIEVHHLDVYKRLEMWEKFEQVRRVMTERYPGELTWTETLVTESGKEVCRIAERAEPANILDPEQWPSMWNWLMQHMLDLEDTFDEVQTFLKFHIDAIHRNLSE